MGGISLPVSGAASPLTATPGDISRPKAGAASLLATTPNGMSPLLGERLFFSRPRLKHLLFLCPHLVAFRALWREQLLFWQLPLVVFLLILGERFFFSRPQLEWLPFSRPHLKRLPFLRPHLVAFRVL